MAYLSLIRARSLAATNPKAHEAMLKSNLCLRAFVLRFPPRYTLQPDVRTIEWKLDIASQVSERRRDFLANLKPFAISCAVAKYNIGSLNRHQQTKLVKRHEAPLSAVDRLSR